MRIILADAIWREAWEAFADAQPQAAPYHGWGWLEAVRLAYGFAPLPLMALRDGQPAGILPLVRMRLPGMRSWLVSLPYCDCSGPLAENEATRRDLLEHALKLARQDGAAGLEIRQEAPSPATSAKVLMRLSLPAGAQRLMAAFPSKLRSQIKRPMRDGLRAMTGGRELLPPFYRVFSQNMRDLGSPNHSKRWFEAVLRGYGNRARITVVFMPDGSPAAGAVWLVHGSKAFNPWASALRTLSRHSPNMLLYWTMLSQAADEGLTEFDMGRSAPDGGTYRFKRQWGARELGLSWQRFDPATRRPRSPSDAAAGPTRSRKLFAACWRHLPVGLANVAGPALRRYISL